MKPFLSSTIYAAIILGASLGLVGCGEDKQAASTESVSSVTEPASARDFLQTCLPLEQVKALTGLDLTQTSQTTSPQPSCEYVNSDVISNQHRVLYAHDPAYKKPFGFEPVDGLGTFAEYDDGTLMVGLGSDGITFVARAGKQKLAVDKLKDLASAVLAK